MILCNMIRGIKVRQRRMLISRLSWHQTLKHWSNLAWQHCCARLASRPCLFIRPAQEKKSWIHNPQIFPIIMVFLQSSFYYQSLWLWPQMPGTGRDSPSLGREPCRAQCGPSPARAGSSGNSDLSSKKRWSIEKLQVASECSPCLLTRLHETLLRAQALS